MKFLRISPIVMEVENCRGPVFQPQRYLSLWGPGLSKVWKLSISIDPSQMTMPNLPPSSIRKYPFHSPFPISLARVYKEGIYIYRYFQTPSSSTLFTVHHQACFLAGLAARQSSELSFGDGWTKRLAAGDCIAGWHGRRGIFRTFFFRVQSIHEHWSIVLPSTGLPQLWNRARYKQEIYASGLEWILDWKELK